MAEKVQNGGKVQNYVVFLIVIYKINTYLFFKKREEAFLERGTS